MKDDRVYLLHIRDAIERIRTYVEGGEDDFLAKPMVQDAVIRNLEIIGEATKRLSPAVRKDYPDVPWAKMAALRDVLAHGYMTIDLEVVWDVVANRLEPIAAKVAAILDQNS